MELAKVQCTVAEEEIRQSLDFLVIDADEGFKILQVLHNLPGLALHKIEHGDEFGGLGENVLISQFIDFLQPYRQCHECIIPMACEIVEHPHMEVDQGLGTFISQPGCQSLGCFQNLSQFGDSPAKYITEVRELEGTGDVQSAGFWVHVQVFEPSDRPHERFMDCLEVSLFTQVSVGTFEFYPTGFDSPASPFQQNNKDTWVQDPVDLMRIDGIHQGSEVLL